MTRPPVTGEVDDPWPYINSVDVFVFPLFRGAGVKNKVLEAMYARRAVVTTEIGSEGTGAIPGRHIVLCSTPECFRRAVLRLLRFPEERRRLGEAAHDLVVGNFSWERLLRDFEVVIVGGSATGDRQAS